MAPRKRGSTGNARIVIREKKKVTAKLTLFGPTTEEEGRDLAADLNSVIASFNTRWFLTSSGTKIEPRIAAKTDDVS